MQAEKLANFFSQTEFLAKKRLEGVSVGYLCLSLHCASFS